MLGGALVVCFLALVCVAFAALHVAPNGLGIGEGLVAGRVLRSWFPVRRTMRKRGLFFFKRELDWKTEMVRKVVEHFDLVCLVRVGEAALTSGVRHHGPAYEFIFPKVDGSCPGATVILGIWRSGCCNNAVDGRRTTRKV